MFRPSTGSGPELVEGINKKNHVNRACREPLGRTINPVEKKLRRRRLSSIIIGYEKIIVVISW
jgi:hypothetical protein